MGIAPDTVMIFEERYLANHPEGIETHDQIQDYMDALGYWLRDEYYPSFESAQANLSDAPEPADIKDPAEPLRNLDPRQSVELSELAVQEKYHLSRDEIRKYFCVATSISPDTVNNLLNRMDFVNHYAIDQKRIYGVVINLGTCSVEAVFDYRYDEDSQWPLIVFAAEKELMEGAYIRWSPDSKRRLAELIRGCNLLPDHAYWDTADPSESETDALVAEVFGRPGYPSTVNVLAMADTLFGPADSRTWETRCKMEYLMENYYIREEIIFPPDSDHSAEISSDEAVQVVRKAICQAWDMSEDTMNGWTGIAQLTQMNTDQGGIAFYRVFLTRPESELGQNTFGGRDNFNYRVSLDGTILDSTINPSWHSPSEDAAK